MLLLPLPENRIVSSATVAFPAIKNLLTLDEFNKVRQDALPGWRERLAADTALAEEVLNDMNAQFRAWDGMWPGLIRLLVIPEEMLQSVFSVDEMLTGNTVFARTKAYVYQMEGLGCVLCTKQLD